MDFSLNELCATSTGLDNRPSEVEEARLVRLVDAVLQPARDALGMPVRVTSGYRSREVNRAVGGVARSQHTLGEAADLTCRDNRRLFNYIRDNLPFDQLIWEGGDRRQPAWVHVSYTERRDNRGEVIINN